MSKDRITVEYLRKYVICDAQNGKLFWTSKRPEDINAKTQRMRERICKNWNARYEGQPAFCTIGKRGYYTGCFELHMYYAHRVIWALHTGEWPKHHIDHINGDPLDNRISNLREATHSQNLRNMHLQDRNKTGKIGVWHDKSRDSYQAHISVRGKRKSLGRFKLLKDAIAAREAAEKKYNYHPNHGER